VRPPVQGARTRNPRSPQVGAIVLTQHHVGSSGVGGAVCKRPGLRRGAEWPQETGCGARAARSRPQPASWCRGDLPRVAVAGLWAGVRGGSRVAEGRAPARARGGVEGLPTTPAATLPPRSIAPGPCQGSSVTHVLLWAINGAAGGLGLGRLPTPNEV